MQTKILKNTFSQNGDVLRFATLKVQTAAILSWVNLFTSSILLTYLFSLKYYVTYAFPKHFVDSFRPLLPGVNHGDV